MESPDILAMRVVAPMDVDSVPEVTKHILPETYVPTKYCVLCGRGRECYNSIGNRRFRVLVNIYLERYKDAPNRLVKGQIVSEIIDTVRGSGGQFAKLDDDGSWWEIGDCAAREKIGSLFRDSLHELYRSSSKAKRARKTSLTPSPSP